MKNQGFGKKIVPIIMVGCLGQLGVSVSVMAQSSQTGNMSAMPGMQNMAGMTMPAEPEKKERTEPDKKDTEKTAQKNGSKAKKASAPARPNEQTMSPMDHSKMAPMDADSKAGIQSSEGQQSDKSMKMGAASTTMPAMDHMQMPDTSARSQPPHAPSAGMGQMDHSGSSTAPPSSPRTSPQGAMQGMQMGGMDMGPMQGGSAPPNARDPNAYAEGARRSSMPGMEMADNALFGRILVNELENTRDGKERGQAIDAEAWFGGDYNKAWFKTEAERQNGRLSGMRTEALWDRVFATHWSTQLGARHDTGGGPSKTWLAAGVRGMAPYWFETEATAYLGSAGVLAARVETRYEVLFSQRLILQPKVEANFYSKNDIRRGTGDGLSDLNIGLRLRYEIRRQFAPYIGVSWNRKFGNTADFARLRGERIKNTELVAGVRIWY